LWIGLDRWRESSIPVLPGTGDLLLIFFPFLGSVLVSH
jgi:hypothetical protein